MILNLRHPALIASVGLAAFGAFALGASAEESGPVAAPVPATPELVPRAKLVKAVRARDAYRDEASRWRKVAATSPDAELSLQLAGIVYGQDWRHMQRCWLSEGYRNAERGERRIVRLNRGGSGASGPAQFMPGTWAGTPFGHLDLFNVQAQAFATGWMWDSGRRSEWSGVGCR